MKNKVLKIVIEPIIKKVQKESSFSTLSSVFGTAEEDTYTSIEKVQVGFKVLFYQLSDQAVAQINEAAEKSVKKLNNIKDALIALSMLDAEKFGVKIDDSSISRDVHQKIYHFDWVNPVDWDLVATHEYESDNKVKAATFIGNIDRKTPEIYNLNSEIIAKISSKGMLKFCYPNGLISTTPEAADAEDALNEYLSER